MENTKAKVKISTILLFALCIAAVLFLPGQTNDYSMRVVNNALIFAIVSYGLSIMLGMGGQLTFGGLAFMGGGAFTAANLCSGRLGFWLDPVLAILISALLMGVMAFGLGLILLKLKDTYFTFSTIALVQVAYTFFVNYKPLFGGAGGISNIAEMKIFGVGFGNNYNLWFYFLVVVLAIVAFVVERIRQTQLGRSLASIRDNDTAALTLGVNVYRTKVLAFAIAGIFAGLAGACYALQMRFIGADMFTYERSTLFIIMAMVGGVNNSFGIIIGSLVITVLPEVLRGVPGIDRYLQLSYGLLVIVLMVFMPMGLAGMASALSKRFKAFISKKANAPVAEKEVGVHE
ncbi:branched-chain amino acid ABC transporter permease [Oscillospiraceae bacterium MB08-C2-2]|nr:branched-chain amino acid ABC transporter permease [Oscillospiraceae bacterium MB08-C2-2]